MAKFKFKLYVAGDNHLSRIAIDNFKRLIEPRLDGEFEMEVLDIVENPKIALQQRILATPLLVREFPEPVVYLLGDLEDVQKIERSLSLHLS